MIVEDLFWPHVIILGGGVRRKTDTFPPHVRMRIPVVAARLLRQAGIVGAALYAERNLTRKPRKKKP